MLASREVVILEENRAPLSWWAVVQQTMYQILLNILFIIDCSDAHDGKWGLQHCALFTFQALDTSMWHFPWQVLINLGLVYKVQQHSGIIFQFVAFIRRRQRAISEILAAGGRYDLLVRAFLPQLVILIFTYLAAPGLSCRMQELWSSLWHANS